MTNEEYIGLAQANAMLAGAREDLQARTQGLGTSKALDDLESVQAWMFCSLIAEDERRERLRIPIPTWKKEDEEWFPGGKNEGWGQG